MGQCNGHSDLATYLVNSSSASQTNVMGELKGRLSSEMSGDGGFKSLGVMFQAPMVMARLGSLSASKAKMEMVFLASLLKISRFVMFGEDVDVFIIVN